MSFNLIQFIPKNCKRILEIGCADGALGEYILQNKICEEFVGLELLNDKANIASTKLSQVIRGDAEAIDLKLHTVGEFDCIIYADSLEHMKNPLNVLSHHLTRLKKDGCVIASIPNVRNLLLIEQLIQGRWIYTDWGLLDRTHFHLFTFKDLQILFNQAGLRVDKVECSRRPGQWFNEMHKTGEINQQFLELYEALQNAIEKNIDHVKSVLNERYSMEKITDQDVQELFTVQFHLVATRI
jgi:2-polyprenyl-3-methyl-5-hydroxy-6-metoxy-1,4-benzoquinol methylase